VQFPRVIVLIRILSPFTVAVLVLKNKDQLLFSELPGVWMLDACRPNYSNYESFICSAMS